MEREKFVCQICYHKFTTIFGFKKHLTSNVHKQSFRKVYPNEYLRQDRGIFIPWIFFKAIGAKHVLTQPILGLSQMTLCFSSDTANGFYLCHVCEQTCQIKNVIDHVFHGDHYSNYFAYTDPNVLNFAWMSSSNVQTALMPNIKQEIQKTGIGELKVLHLPTKLQKQCLNKTYCKVMILLSKNKLLSDMFKDIKPERVRIQSYRDDANRKHPLLGLQHLVECVCVGQYEKTHYLCTLCNFHVSSCMVIKHVLSFDHIFCYFNAWHPSTLMARASYRNCSPDFTHTLIELAKQSQEIHGPAEIQQVMLKPDELISVFGSSFRAALEKIGSISKKGSLMPIVTPGMKLEPASYGGGNTPTNVKLESKPEPVTPENSTLTQNVKQENEPTTCEPIPTPAAPSYSLHCQNCTRKFETDTLYFNHLSTCGHQEMFKKVFGAANDKAAIQCKPHLPLYNDLTGDSKDNQPCVGVSLVVTILSHQLSDEPIYVCFACEACFLKRNLKHHLNSQKHFIQTLMYQNPWRLPFAWKNGLDYKSLKLQACEEGEERGPDQKMIKILDVPSHLFPHLFPLNFTKVMEKLNRYHTHLMNGVPRRETFSKLQENERFPLLGRDFLVKYGQTVTGWKFLCLLCERTLSADEYNGHIFSWEHVVSFLENYHPGSFDLNTANEEILLDLAKQAARIHRVSNEQVIEFDRQAFEVTDYSTKVRLLSAEKARDGKGTLMPCITAQMKLVPRQKQTQEKDASLTRANDTKTTNESGTVKNNQSVPEKTAEKGVDDFQSPDQGSVEPMEICLQEKSNEPIQKAVKEEVDELPTNPSASMEEIKSTNTKNSDCKSVAAASKRPYSMSEMDHCTSETTAGEQDPKRRRLFNLEEKEKMPKLQNVDLMGHCSLGDTAVTNPVPSCSPERKTNCLLWAHVQRRIRDPLIGLSALYECVCDDHAPIYLCECCHLKFKEQHIASHLSEAWHYRNYLEMVGAHPLLQGRRWKKDLARFAAYWEKNKGYGKAQVVELTPEDFSKLTLAYEYHKAIHIVKTQLAKENHNTEKDQKNICSTLTTLDENREETVSANGQETMQQEVKMEIDPEPVTTYAKTKITSKTDVNSESSEDSNLIRIHGHTHESNTSGTAADRVCSVSSHSTVTNTTTTTPTISSSTLLSGSKSSAVSSKDGSETANTGEDSSFKIATDAPQLSQPVCKIITAKSVIPEVRAESSSIGKDTSNKMKDTVSPQPQYNTKYDTKPSKPVCKFMTARSSAINAPTSGMTPPAPPDSNCVTSTTCSTTTSTTASSCTTDVLTTETILDDSSRVVADFTPVSSATLSNKTKDITKPKVSIFTTLPQVKFISPEVVPKPQADSCDNDLSTKKVTTTVTSPTVVSSVASAKSTSKTSEICTTSTEMRKPLKLKVNAEPHIPKDDPIVKNHPTTPPVPNSGPQTPTIEPSQKAMPHDCPQVGLDQLLKVTCKGSRQTYCFACLVRLEATNHLISTSHQINCVKLKFPWWSARPSESKLSEMVALLADDEKALKKQCKWIEVTLDVYKDLKALPGDKAVEKLKGIVKMKSSKKKVQRRPSILISEMSTSPCEMSTSPCDISTSPCVSVSPYEATSPDLAGQDHCQTKQKDDSSAMPLEKIPVSVKSASGPSPPVEKPASKAEAIIIKGSTTENLSHLSRFLTVKGMDTPIIGLCFIWECRIVSLKHQETFYLCESCSQTLLFREMFEHMASTEHLGKYILRQYPRFMYWIEEDLPSEMADELINNIADWVSYREASMDAQVVLLSDECFEWVRTAPFVEALKVVQRIRKEKKTTFLPLIVTSQREVEPREQQSIQPTLDSLKTPLTDLQNQMETSILKEADRKTDTNDARQDTTHLDGNAASFDAVSCTSPTEYNRTLSPQITEPSLVSQPQSSASPNLPNQLEDVSSCSVTDHFYSKQNLSGSPKDKHQGQLQPTPKACFNIPSPLSLESTVVSPSVDTTGTTSSVSLKDTNKDTALGTDIQLDSPLHWESCSSTTVISNTEQSDDNATKSVEEDKMTEKRSPQSSSDSTGESASVNTVMAFSTVGHNTPENPALELDIQGEDPMDLHHLKMLIDLVKTAKSMRSTSNQTSVNLVESCSTKSSESNAQMCEAPKSTRWDLEQLLNADTDADPNAESILTEDQSTAPNVTAELPTINSEDNLILSSDVSKVNTEKPASVNMTAVSSELQTQQNLTENINITQLSQGQGFQLQGKVLETESDIQGPHLQNQSQSSKTPVLQTEVQIQKVNSNNYVTNSEDLMQVQVPPSEVQVAPTKGQLSQVQSNIEAVQLQIHQSQSQVLQEEQSQVLQLQSQTQQIQAQRQQVPINSLVTSRPQNTGHFNRGHNERHNQSIVNTSVQVSQGLPTTNATTTPVTTYLSTGGYGQFFQTAYITNENGYPNMNAEYGFPHSSAYPGQFYPQLQAQRYTSMQPFGQSFQNPEASTWFYPNTQFQSVAQTYSAWPNGAVSSVGGTSNMAYPNAVHFNTPNNQSYTNDYNRGQEYNRVLMQNRSFTQPSAPASMNSQFFPNRQ